VVAVSPRLARAKASVRLGLALALSSVTAAGALPPGAQPLLHGLRQYADDGRAPALRSYLHPNVAACVADVAANPIARFVLHRVRTRGVPDHVTVRAVSPELVDTLRSQARRLGLRMPVAPSEELRLAYDDHTARFFLARDGHALKWVLPCRGG